MYDNSSCDTYHQGDDSHSKNIHRYNEVIYSRNKENHPGGRIQAGLLVSAKD